MSEQAGAVPGRVAKALAADESGELDELVRAGRAEDLEALRAVALGEAVVDTPNSRGKAIYALGRWGDPGVPSMLERLLPGLDDQGRVAAIDALGRIGDESDVEVIVRYADDISEQVRKTVVKALARIGGEAAETALAAIAQRETTPWIRSLAARARNA